MVQDKNLEMYKVYVPAEEVETRGVIRLSTDCDEMEVFNADGKFSNPDLPLVNILDVYRIKRNGTENPSNLVKVVFEGPCLPDFVVFESNLVIRVQPYHKKVFFCTKCLSYGHSEAYCSRHVKKCQKCAGSHHESQCTAAIVVCCHCKGPHLPGTKECPTLKRVQTKILKTQTIQLKNRYSELATTVEDTQNTSQAEEIPGPSRITVHAVRKRKHSQKKVAPSSNTKRRDNVSYAQVTKQSSQNTTKVTDEPKMKADAPVKRRDEGHSSDGFAMVFQMIAWMLKFFKVPDESANMLIDILNPFIRKFWSQLTSPALDNSQVSTSQ
jgi:hypothetical protein